MKKYMLLYATKKVEDNICLLNMFENHMKIRFAWTEADVNHNVKLVDNLVNEKYTEIIFASLESGWSEVIRRIRKKHPSLIIKVICSTQDSLLYYEYERTNFFELLELSKNKTIDEIGFLRKGQYEVYKDLGYKCSFIHENYILKDKVDAIPNKDSKLIRLGFYPLNYTWDKNIFNQLCVGKMLDNTIINYNCLDERMTDFLNTMNINSHPVKIEKITEENLIKEIIKNDVVISTSFTEYFHPVFFIAMELGIPCLVGNNIDFFSDEDKIKDYVVTSAEDNAIINADLIKKIINNKDIVIKLYRQWKDKYNKIAKKTIEDFIG